MLNLIIFRIYKASTTSNQKEGLAASIVKKYSFFKDTTDSKKWTWVSNVITTLTLLLIEMLHFKMFFCFHWQWRVYDRKLNRGRIPNVISNLQRKADDKGSGGAVPTNSDDENEDEPSSSSKNADNCPLKSVDDVSERKLIH